MISDKAFSRWRLADLWQRHPQTKHPSTQPRTPRSPLWRSPFPPYRELTELQPAPKLQPSRQKLKSSSGLQDLLRRRLRRRSRARRALHALSALSAVALLGVMDSLLQRGTSIWSTLLQGILFGALLTLGAFWVSEKSEYFAKMRKRKTRTGKPYSDKQIEVYWNQKQENAKERAADDEPVNIVENLQGELGFIERLEKTNPQAAFNLKGKYLKNFRRDQGYAKLTTKGKTGKDQWEDI